MGDSMLQTIPLLDGLTALDDGRVRQFLLTGPEGAILIDAGFADSGVYEAVQALTPGPVTVLLTHGDRDHAGGLPPFGGCFLHPNDWHLAPAGVTLRPLAEGDRFSCGSFHLEVIEIPGHTFGSVAFWDRKKKLLFAGDSVQKEGPIYMFGAHRDLEQYIKSQQKLLAMATGFETVFPCHHACPISPDYIEKNLRDAIALQAGKLPGQPHPTLPCTWYQGQDTQFYY